MTREEAKTFLLQLNTDKQLNKSEHEALRIAIKALEQEPKQVELEGDGYSDGEIVYDHGKCPKCGWIFDDGDKDWEEPYCCHCGQKLEWFDNEAESEEV
jgi:rubrerythrin